MLCTTGAKGPQGGFCMCSCLFAQTSAAAGLAPYSAKVLAVLLARDVPPAQAEVAASMPAVAASANHTGTVLLCLPQMSASSAACACCLSCSSLLQVCVQDYQDAQGCRP